MSIIPSPFVLIVRFWHKKKGTQSHSSGSFEFVNSKVFKNNSYDKPVQKQKNMANSGFTILNTYETNHLITMKYEELQVKYTIRDQAVLNH